MAKKNNILGLSKFQIGPTGDGVMGEDLTDFSEVELNSVTLDGGAGTVTNIPTYSQDAYMSVKDTTDPATVVARLYGVTPEQMVMLAGGEVGPDGLWHKPAKAPSIYRSLNLEGEVIDGERTVLRFPYAMVQARPQGTIANNALPAIEVTLTANTPVSEAGVEGSPVHYGTLSEEI